MKPRPDEPLGTPDHSGDEPPPFLRTWGRLYAAVLVYSAALILALYWVTKTFNR
jgi:hypothetical protein